MIEKQQLGSAIFNDIDSNQYLQDIFDGLLLNQALAKFKVNSIKPKEINIEDALQFADILSKSNHPVKCDLHRMWAQEIILLLTELYPENQTAKIYMSSVLETAGNYRGLQTAKLSYSAFDRLDALYDTAKKEELRIPETDDSYYFPIQKIIYDELYNKFFSYSGPTSLGKSFIAQTYIKQQIANGFTGNYVILVPSKALINEIRNKFLTDLNQMLIEKDYKVITSTSDILLQKKHNYIFVLTPERLVNLLYINPDFPIKFIFVDEAHKISNKDRRSIYYYECIAALMNKIGSSSFIFSSPNIPNPEVYFDLFAGQQTNEVYLSTKYSPVSQFKYLINTDDKTFYYYNEHKQELNKIITSSKEVNLSKLISVLDEDKQNLIYVNSQSRVLFYASNYAESVQSKNNPELDQFAKDIAEEINPEFFLCELIPKGIAYHVGYLPHDIKIRIEKYYSEGLIKTIFCTSTLNEGVNLPADNLFITNYTNGRKSLNEVEFRNLIGRVGRIGINLSGNVFLVSMPDDKKAFIEYKQLLIKPIPRQQLSIEKQLTPAQKKNIVKCLVNGDIEMRESLEKESNPNYEIMRTVALSLAKTIVAGTTSAIRKSFDEILSDELIAKITENFSNEKIINDIYFSYDQIDNLKEAIKKGLSYPKLTDDYKQNRQKIHDFIKQISVIFKWDVYEKKYLGKLGETDTYWFALMLEKWMTGKPLKDLIRLGLIFSEKYPYDGVKIGDNKIAQVYNKDNYTHKNCAMADTLQRVENTILFNITNYFRAFSATYKEEYTLETLDNDWYEFVEYGSMEPAVKRLQQLGFSRNSALYIFNNKTNYLVEYENNLLIKSSLLECPSESVKLEANTLIYNINEFFVT